MLSLKWHENTTHLKNVATLIQGVNIFWVVRAFKVALWFSWVIEVCLSLLTQGWAWNKPVSEAVVLGSQQPATTLLLHLMGRGASLCMLQWTMPPYTEHMVDILSCAWSCHLSFPPLLQVPPNPTWSSAWHWLINRQVSSWGKKWYD